LDPLPGHLGFRWNEAQELTKYDIVKLTGVVLPDIVDEDYNGVSINMVVGGMNGRQ